ncbi:MAG: response regulator transcription factor [Gemmatimonadetes bacterium]|nr:response regulator transcription factor [Gemmatimonadota bacterium]
MPSILIIEDNADIAFGLRNNLEIEGHTVEIAGDGKVGLERTRAMSPDLVILDLMIPIVDGYRVLRTLREEGISTPVLILSARNEEADKVRGFRLGADDYVTKPFGLLELIARVDRMLQRSASFSSAAAPLEVRFDDLTIDLRGQQVYRDGRLVKLRPREYDLLVALARRPGVVISREDLLHEVWGHPVNIATRTVDAHIVELRRQLEKDPTRPRHIITVQKAGYRFNV